MYRRDGTRGPAGQEARGLSRQFQTTCENQEKRRTGLRIHEEEEEPNYYAKGILITMAEVR